MTMGDSSSLAPFDNYTIFISLILSSITSDSDTILLPTQLTPTFIISVINTKYQVGHGFAYRHHRQIDEILLPISNFRAFLSP